MSLLVSFSLYSAVHADNRTFAASLSLHRAIALSATIERSLLEVSLHGFETSLAVVDHLSRHHY